MAPAVFAYDSRFVWIWEKGMFSTSATRLRTRAVAWCGSRTGTQPIHLPSFKLVFSFVDHKIKER